MVDMHVHSNFSHDGKSEMPEYANALSGGRVSAVGFAEHVDFLPECGGYKLFDYPKFKEESDRLKYAGYPIYAGAEVDYASSVEEEIRETLAAQHYDFVISSVHMIDGISVSDGRNVDLFKDPEFFRDIIERYYNEIEASIQVEDFDVIGHIGIYKRYMKACSPVLAEMHKHIDCRENKLARICAASGKIIEVNSSGLYAPWGETFPGGSFLREYYKNGGRSVVFGSDAHHISHLCRGYSNVCRELHNIGFRYMVLPWSGEKIKLEHLTLGQ